MVIFQFNPENLSRIINIPDYSPEKIKGEVSQAASAPTESISFSAFFNAVDLININEPFSKQFGVSSQLAALEKMVYPSQILSGLMGKAIDAIGSLLSSKTQKFSTPIPRFEKPKILFIWGATRILPVLIDSLTIKETHYNQYLNPIEAEVSLNLSVLSLDNVSDDEIAKGALKYTNLIKDLHAVENLKNIGTEIKDYLTF